MDNILKVENFRLSFHGPLGTVCAVKGVDLAVKPGEVLALVGESGCGKTALCRAVMMLHASHASVDGGRILLCGRDVTKMTEKELEQVRGRDAAMVFQDPMTSLNPVLSIGRQIMEPVLIHEKVSKAQVRERAIRLLEQVGIPEPELRFYQYPHHFSGGMRQRAAIAIALALNPRLLIADEPTTSLDIHTQEQIMKLLKEVCSDGRRGMIFVTHDLGLAEEMADRIVVMKGGVIVESGTPQEIFGNPRHEYTKELIRYAGYGKKGSHFHGKAGNLFCAEADDSWGEEISGETLFREAPSGGGFTEEAQKAMVRVSGLTKSFPVGRKQVRRVLEDFDLTVYKGEILGIVGPSGCGKSTLARCLMGIYEGDGGTITFAEGCRKQMIFQDSASAFNPRMTLEEIIGEPLRIRRRNRQLKISGRELRERVYEMMGLVGLSENLAGRHPYDVSGGQRQRAAIARALITEPDFIIADEPISSLDVSIQAQIVHLLKELHDKRNLTILLIAHDLPMVTHISDRIVEMG